MDFRNDRNIRYTLDIRAESDPTIQSQYSTSERIVALVNSHRLSVLPDADIDLFFKNIFDIETAQGVGLDIWGRILGIERIMPTAETEHWFGFAEADFEPFGQDPFWDGDLNIWNATLEDDQYRQLLMWKAAANISTADAASLNFLLQEIFRGKEIVVREKAPMAIALYVYFDLQNYERAILENYGLMAKGAGVGFSWVEIPLPVFGFAEADYDPFNQAPFWNGGYVSWKENSYNYFGFLESNCQPFNQAPFWDQTIPYFGFAEAYCTPIGEDPFWDGKEII